MVHDPENPFADIECDWEKVEKAKPGMSTGRIPPWPAYKGVCVAFDPKGDGNMVDHELLAPVGKNKGVKISIEILDPMLVEEETVKGKTYEHIFWISAANWPYVKRDAENILGAEVKTPLELLKAVWAGHTVEFGIKDETYNGFVRSKSTHFNLWAPEKSEAKTETKKSDDPKGKQKTAAQKAVDSKADQKVVAGTSKKDDVDF